MGKAVKTFRVDPDVAKLLETKIEYGEFGPWINTVIRDQLAEPEKDAALLAAKKPAPIPHDAGRSGDAVQPAGVGADAPSAGGPGLEAADGAAGKPGPADPEKHLAGRGGVQGGKRPPPDRKAEGLRLDGGPGDHFTLEDILKERGAGGDDKGVPGGGDV